MNQENEKIAKEFLQMIASGNIDEAYETFVNMAGKHHNIFSQAGFAGLREAMKENDAMFPNKKFEMKHIVSDKNMVVTHSHLILKTGETELIAFHMLRFQNGKIIEMWDCAQPIPAEHKDEDGLF